MGKFSPGENNQVNSIAFKMCSTEGSYTCIDKIDDYGIIKGYTHCHVTHLKDNVDGFHLFSRVPYYLVMTYQ